MVSAIWLPGRRLGCATALLVIDISCLVVFAVDIHDGATTSDRADEQAHSPSSHELLRPFENVEDWLLRRLSAIQVEDSQHRLASNALQRTEPKELGAETKRDYEFLNALVRVLTVDLGDHGPYNVGIGEQVTIHDLVCTDIYIGSVASSTSISDDHKQVAVKLDLGRVHLKCHASYTTVENTPFGSYQNGQGQFNANSNSVSSVGVRLVFEGKDFHTYPPRSVKDEACRDLTKFSFDEVIFKGATATDILGNLALQQKVGDSLAKSFRDTLCGDRIPNLVSTLMQKLQGMYPAFLASEPLSLNYSSLRDDDAAADQLADQSGRQTLSLVDDPMTSLLLKVKKWVNVNSMIKGLIQTKVPNRWRLAGNEVLYTIVGEKGMQATIVLKSLTLEGINTASDVAIFETTSKHSATHSIIFDRISLQAELAWNLRGPHEEKSYPANLTLAVEGVKIALQTLIALDSQKWMQISLGSIFQSVAAEKPAACILQALLAAEVSDLKVTFDSLITSEVQAPPTDEGVSSGLGHVLQILTDAALDLYGGFAENTLAPYYFQTLLSKMLNSRLTDFITDPHNLECPAFNYDLVKAQLANYTLSPFSDLSRMLFDFTHPDSKVQDKMSDITKANSGRPGVLKLFGDGWYNRWEQDKYAPFFDFSINITDVHLAGFQGVHDLSLLQPLEAYKWHSTLGLGNFVERPRMVFHLDLSYNMLDQKKVAKQVVDQADAKVTLSIRNLMLILDIFSLLNVNKVLNLTVDQVFNYQCVFGSFEDFAVEKLALLVEDFAVDIECANYTGACSPEVVRIANRGQNKDVRKQTTLDMNDYLQRLLSLLTTPSASLNFWRVMHRDHNYCYGRPNPYNLDLSDPFALELNLRKYNGLLVFWVGWGIPVLWICSIGVAAFLWIWVCRPFREDPVAVSTVSDKKLDKITRRATRLWKTTLQTHTLPFVSAIVLNIFFFLIAHFHMGAEANLALTLLQNEATYEDWRDFSVLQTISTLFQHGAYLLGVLIMIFSVIWPYVKLFALLAIIFISPERLSYHNRGKVLFLMDRLGKYSMLDVYFIILVFAFLQLTIGTYQSSALLGHDFMKVQLQIRPCMGIICLVLGVLLSIVLNQIALAMHRRAVERLTGESPRHLLLTEKEALCNHEWRVLRGIGFKQKMRNIGKIAISVLLLACCALILIGWFLPMADTEIHGVAGAVAQMQGIESHRQYHSFWGMAVFAMDQARNCTWGFFLGISMIVLCHVVFAGVLPLLQVVCMLVLWLKPLTLRGQKSLNLFIQALSAVASLEVFLFGICVAYLEIGNLSESFLPLSIVDNWDVGLYLRYLNAWGVVDKVSLFGVDVAFHYGFAVLAWGATLFCFLSSSMIEWSKEAEQDRLAKFEGRGMKPHTSNTAVSELQAKLQYVCAFVGFMRITDLGDQDAMDAFWKHHHRGGPEGELDIQAINTMTLQTSSEAESPAQSPRRNVEGSRTLVEPLLPGVKPR